MGSLETYGRTETTIDLKSFYTDGSLKEHLRIHPDGTEEMIYQKQEA